MGLATAIVLKGLDELVIDRRDGISLADAIAWANSLPEHVTLFVYDAGSGTT
jgi:hypothetical protein